MQRSHAWEPNSQSTTEDISYLSYSLKVHNHVNGHHHLASWIHLTPSLPFIWMFGRSFSHLYTYLHVVHFPQVFLLLLSRVVMLKVPCILYEFKIIKSQIIWTIFYIMVFYIVHIVGDFIILNTFYRFLISPRLFCFLPNSFSLI